MEFNFLHYSFLNNNESLIEKDILNYIERNKIVYIKNYLKEKELPSLKNKEVRESVFNDFLEDTGVPLDSKAYDSFLEHISKKDLSAVRGKVLSKTLSLSEVNSLNVTLPKTSFFKKLFKSSGSGIQLSQAFYSACIFNKRILERMKKDSSKELHALLDLNKYLLFPKDSFEELYSFFEGKEVIHFYDNAINECESLNESNDLNKECLEKQLLKLYELILK